MKKITDTQRLNWLVEQKLWPHKGVLEGGEIPGGDAARYVIDAAIRASRTEKK